MKGNRTRNDHCHRCGREIQAPEERLLMAVFSDPPLCRDCYRELIPRKDIGNLVLHVAVRR